MRLSCALQHGAMEGCAWGGYMEPEDSRALTR
eukprot:CAMPEP_0175888724 /NCGR_PEP_ID=MMETSP0107_2-20121207/46886_1 /TAXON_ID=195067 ORGANISM="Goniomonas pacifica, Strain CCMP1869" /NCGR_SAMPLE_ID=MMETSP0107_2 /ASSEMBLY_ACC=CAM_ASM_000203 /LENGTH=31 /DNA_ID= /DNA_START= /DNA_END= /DNA_ORIENTATION=